MKSIDSTKAYKELISYSKDISDFTINDLFAKEPNRFKNYSIEFDEILFDYSKNRIDAKAFKLLLQLAKEANLKSKIEAMFAGEKINNTEKRAVLHTALRNVSDKPVYIDNRDVMPQVKAVLSQMKKFSEAVRSGSWRGCTDKKITDIVNIGIGGSDLGPAMVCNALRPYAKSDLKAHFVSNVDSSDIAETLKELDPQTTLFIIASKTFTTQETIRNANTAKNWFLKKGASNIKDIAKHFVAISTNEEAVREFGIDTNNMFVFWNWVGGRYSLWSSIGLSIALYIGYDNFEKLLAGAHKMDMHFLHSDFSHNIPVIMGLLGIWYSNFLGASSKAVIPYDSYLSRFPAFLQQLDMESNGKLTDKYGAKIMYKTGIPLWGEAGTNAQHSFFQLLHQGSGLIPIDFLAPINNHNEIDNHHHILIANFLAQTEALMKGKSLEEVRNELKKAGLNDDFINEIAQHKVFTGNKPTNTILYKKLTPFTLGMLTAMYEHSVFTQGAIWNINSFDQWGVELGKQLAGKILPELESSELISSHDDSTNSLINYFKAHRD